MSPKERSGEALAGGAAEALAPLGLLPLVAVFLIEGASALTLPAGFLSTPEGLHFYSAYRFGRFLELYSPERLLEPPFVACPYMPVYPVAFGLLQRLFGPTPICGRALSLAAALWGPMSSSG